MLAILCFITTEWRSRPTTEIMISGVATVLRTTKVLGGTRSVIAPTSMVATSRQEIHLLKESTGTSGKTTTDQ